MTGEPPRLSRSEEEREAARLARERARAERASKDAAKPPRAAKASAKVPRATRASLKVPRIPKPSRAERPPEEAPLAEPPRVPKPPRVSKPPRAEPSLPPELEAESPALDAKPPRGLPKPRLRRAPAPASVEPEAEPQPRVVAPDRASVRERADALLSSRREARPDAPRGRFRIRRIVVLGVLLLTLVVGAWLLLSVFQPGKGEGEGTVAITIPAGSGVGDIGELLSERGVVDSGLFFELRATLGGSRSDLKPGIYELRRDMSYSAAINVLSQGPSPNLVNVTIPEGTARREMAGRIKKAGLKGNYVRASTRSRALNPRRYGATNAKDLEGFLFPATYQLRKGSTMNALVEKQLAAFKENWAKVNLKAARRAKLTPYDVLIIASLVEREAQLDKERPLVASVVYNRLRAGMNLGIDATVRYALNNWTEPLKRSELQSPSPYNTYNHPGLPPGPIGNPGLASMRAAARPARTKFLYYVVKPNTCGEHAFAESADEHDRNAARYNAARAARGGQSPTDC